MNRRILCVTGIAVALFAVPTASLLMSSETDKPKEKTQVELPPPPERVADAAEQSAVCMECHTEIEELLVGDKHIADDFHCVVCHGPSQAHLDMDVEGTLPDRVWRRWQEEEIAFKWRVKDASLEIAKYCASCHAKKPPEGEKRPTIDFQEYLKTGHGVAVCGGSHDAATCTDCHYAHGAGCEPLTDEVVTERCSLCHADQQMMEKAGMDPNVIDDFENDTHADMSSVDDEDKSSCILCHYPH